mgnify:CR=1 FL=1
MVLVSISWGSPPSAGNDWPPVKALGQPGAGAAGGTAKAGRALAKSIPVAIAPIAILFSLFNFITSPQLVYGLMIVFFKIKSITKIIQAFQNLVFIGELRQRWEEIKKLQPNLVTA